MTKYWSSTLKASKKENSRDAIIILVILLCLFLLIKNIEQEIWSMAS